MNRDLVLRRERPGDLEPTRALHDLAFGVPDGAEHSVETRILDRLRAEGDVLDALTLVADLHGEAVGHVVCSRATMGEGPSIALGPIAVHPDHQGEGIGSALVAAVLVTADLGGRAVGRAARRPGLVRALRLPDRGRARHRLARPLGRPVLPGQAAAGLAPRAGRAFRYPPAFDLDQALTWGSDLERPPPYR